ncbi:MAG: site-specific integrase [Methanomassiliicoccales archaeon]
MAYREDYLARLEKEKRAPKTITEYRRLIVHATHALEVAGLEPSPKKIGEEEIDYLRNELYAHLEPVVGRRQLAIIGTYLKWHGNIIVEHMKIAWPQDMRIHADWLRPMDAVNLLDHAKGMERIIVHLELCLGLRRVEVLRLKMQDLRLGHLDVLGKGTCGGKPRSVPMHRDTMAELAYYMQLRNMQIAEAQARDPNVTIPVSLLIYRKGSRLLPYHKNSIDNRLGELSERIGLKFGNHTLRRTFGRIAYYSGAKVATISAIMGHESEAQTMRYLGIEMDQMAEAMDMMSQYTDALKKGNSVLASGNGGPKEI